MRICRQRRQGLPRDRSMVVTLKRHPGRPIGQYDVIPCRHGFSHDARHLIEIRPAGRAPRIQRRDQDHHQHKRCERNTGNAIAPADCDSAVNSIRAGGDDRQQAKEVPGLHVVIQKVQKQDVSCHTDDEGRCRK